MDTEVFSQRDLGKTLVEKPVRDIVAYIIFKQFTIGTIDQSNIDLSLSQKGFDAQV